MNLNVFPLCDTINGISLLTTLDSELGVFKTEDVTIISLPFARYDTANQAIKGHNKIMDYLNKNPISHEEFRKKSEQIAWDILAYRRRNILEETYQFELMMKSLAKFWMNQPLCSMCCRKRQSSSSAFH